MLEVHWLSDASHCLAYLVHGESLVVIDPIDASNNLAGTQIAPFVEQCQRLVAIHGWTVEDEGHTPEQIGWIGDPDCWDIAAGWSSD
mmetsp:Transcript_142727/g.455613  ORF Transcript_142727/g.455613 Transcript_142727/m.455613 type:complete len:87 (+) Transcript_142727:751-1011(+)